MPLLRSIRRRLFLARQYGCAVILDIGGAACWAVTGLADDCARYRLLATALAALAIGFAVWTAIASLVFLLGTLLLTAARR